VNAYADPPPDGGATPGLSLRTLLDSLGDDDWRRLAWAICHGFRLGRYLENLGQQRQ